jgi:predicted glycosyl hydrolase (DUF1957 family)
MEAFFDQRLAACAEAPASLAKTGESHLLPLVDYWRGRLLRLRRVFHDVDDDLVGGFRALEAAGRLEIIGSAATHGFLPLLARDESIRFQLAVGTAEHRRRHLRRPAAGCPVRVPAARPGRQPTAPRHAPRHRGHSASSSDAHLASAGHPRPVGATPPRST